MKEKFKGGGAHRGDDAVYALGIFGAIIYYFQHADNFWMVLTGIFKAIFWPAFLIHAVLTNLNM